MGLSGPRVATPLRSWEQRLHEEKSDWHPGLGRCQQPAANLFPTPKEAGVSVPRLSLDPPPRKELA